MMSSPPAKRKKHVDSKFQSEWLTASKGQNLHSASCAILILQLEAVEFMK